MYEIMYFCETLVILLCEHMADEFATCCDMLKLYMPVSVPHNLCQIKSEI